MSVLLTLIGIALVCVWALTIVDIVRSHLGAAKTAAWVLIVVLLPFVGAIAYWALRKPTAEEVKHQVDADRELRSGRHRPV